MEAPSVDPLTTHSRIRSLWGPFLERICRAPLFSALICLVPLCLSPALFPSTRTHSRSSLACSPPPTRSLLTSAALFNPKRREALVRHEAGHFLLAVVLGCPVQAKPYPTPHPTPHTTPYSTTHPTTHPTPHPTPHHTTHRPLEAPAPARTRTRTMPARSTRGMIHDAR